MERTKKSLRKRTGLVYQPFRGRLYARILILILILLLIPFLLALFSPRTTNAIFKLKENITSVLESIIRREKTPVCSEELEEMIKTAGIRHGVDFLLVKAIIKVESAFDPMAVSPAGAQGLMQLMPDTAKDMKVESPHDPWENINGGTKYLAWLLKRYEGDLELALAAYNAGPKKVSQYGKVPPFEETKRFIQRVMKSYDEYKAEASPEG